MRAAGPAVSVLGIAEGDFWAPQMARRSRAVRGTGVSLVPT